MLREIDDTASFRAPRFVSTTELRELAVQPREGWYPPCKPAIEFVLALMILVFAAPVILLAAIIVKLTSHGPAFYTQRRVGKTGRRFTIYKIRTMLHDCECGTGAIWCKPGDERITRVGRFLRATHIDEFPQLLNVLRGEMSLVGPRPERPEFVHELEKNIPGYSDRLVVRPGITGMAQLYLPPDTDLKSVERKLVYDLYYVRSLTLWLDLRVLICTALYLLTIPAHLSRRLCLLPKRESVQEETGESTAVPEVTPLAEPA